MTIQLWHCKDSRSLRALWALEETGIPYQLHILPFPPRVEQPQFLNINELGTVPYFVDGDINMTESVAICQYLVDHYNKTEFTVDKQHPDYADYLNWLYHSDATLTFPQTLYLRYTLLEKDKTHLTEVADSYRNWYLKRLRRLNTTLQHREYLCADRFTIADIAIGYALYLGDCLKLSAQYEPQVTQYLQRLMQRPAFARACSKT